MTIKQKPFILKNTTALKNKTITHLYRQHTDKNKIISDTCTASLFVLTVASVYYKYSNMN